MDYAGADIKDWVLLIAGNLFVIILVIRALSCYAKKEWGEMFGLLAISAILAWIIWGTDSFINFLEWLRTRFTGS